MAIIIHIFLKHVLSYCRILFALQTKEFTCFWLLQKKKNIFILVSERNKILFCSINVFVQLLITLFAYFYAAFLVEIY